MKGFVVKPTEMQLHEAYTCTVHSLDEFDLIQAAGAALFHDFTLRMSPKKDELILIVAGFGHNGSDSIEIGKCLLEAGYTVMILAIKPLEKADFNIKSMLDTINPEIWSLVDETIDLTRYFETAKYLIDGIFGIGLNRKVDGAPERLIKMINQADASVYSIDIPSGINATTGETMGIAVQANQTGAIDYYKFGHMLLDGPDASGDVKIVHSGIMMDPSLPKRPLVDSDDIRPLYSPRKKRSHKYDYGNILVIGGHPGMMGAPQLSAMASLRSGAGLATVSMPARDMANTQLVFPEVMFAGYSGIDDFHDILKKIDVVVFGPGLGKDNPLNEAILKLLLESKKSLIIDADGLYYLKKQLDSLPSDGKLILTPHSGEMARLTGFSLDEIERDPETSIRKLTDLGITVVLKGFATIIANSNHFVFVADGNPGMATAGTGDVLSGIIAGLLGRKIDLFDAAWKAVWIQQNAAKLATKEKGEESLVASDLIDKIPDAIRVVY